VGALARHDAVRDRLFAGDAQSAESNMARVHRLLVSVEKRAIVSDVLDEIVSTAGQRVSFAAEKKTKQQKKPVVHSTRAQNAAALSAALYQTANAVIRAETAPERTASQRAWYAAHPLSQHTPASSSSGRSQRLVVSDGEAARQLAALDSVSRRTAAAAPRKTSYGRKTNRKTSRERNWSGGDRRPVDRKSTQPAGGAAEREKNLRLERAQRDDIKLYRELSSKAEEREQLVSSRIAETRVRKRHGLVRTNRKTPFFAPFYTI
jgi:hypothetical protein